LHISCLQLLILVDRAKLTFLQRRQLSALLVGEMLPLTLAWWNLSPARQRQLLNQVDQLKTDLIRRLPQNQERVFETIAANRYARAAQSA
jgi:hypothetical protein